MTNEEAIKKLKNILVEASENDDSICYVTSDDADALKAAIQALEQQSCEDCISREDALEEACEFVEIGYNGKGIFRRLKELPSVTPSRSKGKWIHWTDDYKDYVTCSCCAYGEEGEVLMKNRTPYCPICGTKMEGWADDE